MAKASIIGFYHPHKRQPYTGQLVDHKTGEVFTPPSMTKQEFKRECDINNIVRDFQVTGMVTHINARAQAGAYIDLPSDLDFQSSVEVVNRARASFMTLPSKIRDRFGNDPAQFLAFVGNPANIEEMYTLGLATRPRDQKPPEPPPGPPEPAAQPKA